MKKFKRSPSIETNMVNEPPLNAEIQSSRFYTKNEDSSYTTCTKCSSSNLKLNGKIITCQKCFATFLFNDSVILKPPPEAKTESKEIGAKSLNVDQNETVKSYNFRKGPTKCAEPEVIELIDSSEDEEVKSKKNLPLKARDKLNIDTDSQIKYKFEEWDIKPTDCRPFKNKKIFGNDKPVKFQLKVKTLKLGAYTNTYQKNVQNEELSADSYFLKFDTDGINIQLSDSNCHIGITLGNDDVIYCAAMFEHPCYFLCIKLEQFVSNLYRESLKELDSYKDDSDGNLSSEMNSTRMFLILDLNKESAFKAACDLDAFFKQQARKGSKDGQLDFINLKKTYEIVSSYFRNDDSLEEIKFVYTKYADFQDIKNLFVKYPFTDQDAVVLKSNDLMCLNKGEFLNDNIISFYLKYIFNEILSPEDRKRTHIFDTFFYQKLTQRVPKQEKSEEKMSAAQIRYQRVKKWTRNVNIFEKDFLIIPINKNNHWYLAIICYPKLSEPVYKNQPEGLIKKEEFPAGQLFSQDSAPSSSISSNSNSDLNYRPNSEEIAAPLKTYSFRNTKKRVNTADFNLDSDSADEAVEESEDANSDIYSPESLKKLGPCLKRPVILIFDSLNTSKKVRVLATLKQYLECEWNEKYSKEKGVLDIMNSLSGSSVYVPLQDNFYDCGIYLLQYVEKFFTDPIADFTLPIDLGNWFGISEVKNKRQEIEKILKELSASQKRLKTEKFETGYEEKQHTENEPSIETKIETKYDLKSLDSMDFTESEGHVSLSTSASNGNSELEHLSVPARSQQNIKPCRGKKIREDMDNLV